MRGALALVVLAACAPPAPERAKAWAAPTFFAERDAQPGGFSAKRLAVKAGEEVPWRPGSVASGDALVVQPAFADGAPAAYVVTEVWERHPDLWVQPVYLFVSEWDATSPTSRRTGADNVFGVGTDSTFYSPFWRAYFAEARDAAGPFIDVAQISKFPMHPGALVLCPIVPDRVGLSAGEHPFTGALLQTVRVSPAYANGVRVSYLDLGVNRQETYGENDDLVAPHEMFFFVKLAADGTRTLLDLPAVMPEDADEYAYVRRVDVALDRQAVFVPASRPDLKASLSPLVTVPDTDPAIPAAVASAYLLRVAADSSCFSDAAMFPQGCEWIDSAEAVHELTSESRRFETDVTLTATGVLLP